MNNQKSIKSDHVKLALILLVFLIILLTPTYLRIKNNQPILPGKIAYYNLRIAENIHETSSIVRYDQLSYSGKIISTPIGLPVLLAITSFGNFEITCIILNILFAVLSFILIYLILKNLNIKRNMVYTILSIFIISPAIITTFSTCNNYFIPFFLGLLTFYLLLKNKVYLTALPLFILIFFSIQYLLLTLIMLVFFSIKKNNKKIYLIISLILIITLLYYYPIIKHGFPEKLSIQDRSFNANTKRLIADFSGEYGLSIFTFLLGLAGLGFIWRNKYNPYIILSSTLILFLIALYSNFTLPYLSLLFAIFATFGIKNIIKTRWESRLIKNLIFIILILGIFSSGISIINQHKNSLPNQEIVSSLEFLKQNYADGAVFSGIQNGFFIAKIANAPVFYDENVAYAPEINQRLEHATKLFNTRNIEEATEIIVKYNIKYIYITPEMKKSIWKDDEDGLLFLLKYSKKFKNIYINDNIEVWEVKEGI